MIKLIKIHLIPNGGEKTREPKGTKHVQVLNLEDKRQIIMVVSSSAIRNLLPPQCLHVLHLRHYHQIIMVMVGILLLGRMIHWSSSESTFK
jgi:hypothetical protein